MSLNNNNIKVYVGVGVSIGVNGWMVCLIQEEYQPVYSEKGTVLKRGGLCNASDHL